MALALWWVLLASVVGLLPFTTFSTFLVPIAEGSGSDPASVGALRGLGGVSALVVGVGVAPLIDRIVKRRTCAAAMFLLSAMSLVGTVGGYLPLLIFCLGVGGATAVLTPALLSMAAGRFTDEATSGRAATMVTASQSLAAIGAGPVTGGLALWSGWRGALVITAVLAAIVGAGFLVRPTPEPSAAPTRPGYFTAFAEIARRAEIVGLVTIATLRTAAFMGYLAYLALVYHDRAGLDAGTVTLVWTLSGAAFFVGNTLAGRKSAPADGPRHYDLMIAGLTAAVLATVLVFLVPVLPAMLLATTLMGIGHATVAAAVTTRLVRADAGVRTAALSVNAAGMSLGVFLGTAAGALGLAAAGYPGLTGALGGLTLVALLVAVHLRGRMRDT